MANFDIYSSPDVNTAYSSQFFNDLTFLQATGINYPMIAPSGCAKHWIFANEVPAAADAILVMPGETVLHSNDLQTLMDEARGMFNEGKRAVHVSVTINGRRIDNVYHFAKVC